MYFLHRSQGSSIYDFKWRVNIETIDFYYIITYIFFFTTKDINISEDALAFYVKFQFVKISKHQPVFEKILRLNITLKTSELTVKYYTCSMFLYIRYTYPLYIQYTYILRQDVIIHRNFNKTQKGYRSHHALHFFYSLILIKLYFIKCIYDTI